MIFWLRAETSTLAIELFLKTTSIVFTKCTYLSRYELKPSRNEKSDVICSNTSAGIIYREAQQWNAVEMWYDTVIIWNNHRTQLKLYEPYFQGRKLYANQSIATQYSFPISLNFRFIYMFTKCTLLQILYKLFFPSRTLMCVQDCSLFSHALTKSIKTFDSDYFYIPLELWNSKLCCITFHLETRSICGDFFFISVMLTQ